MAKIKKKLTTAQKRSRKIVKAEQQNKYTWVFMNGKQVKVKRPPTIEGISIDEYIQQNADPIWLHQNEMNVPEQHQTEYPLTDGSKHSFSPLQRLFEWHRVERPKHPGFLP